MMKKTQATSPKTYQDTVNEFEGYATARENNSGNEANISEDEDNIWSNDDNNFALYDSDDEPQNTALSENNRMIMLEFREYLSYANKHFRRFTKTEKTAIKCMVMLRKTKSSLSTCL
jgi:hypothetical protein